MENYIILKSGILKAYNFTDNFIKDNEKLVNKLADIFDEFYSVNCSVFGASETHKNNNDIKIRLINILKEFYNMNIIIENGFTDEIYKDLKEIEDYILNYGK